MVKFWVSGLNVVGGNSSRRSPLCSASSSGRLEPLAYSGQSLLRNVTGRSGGTICRRLAPCLRCGSLRVHRRLRSRDSRRQIWKELRLVGPLGQAMQEAQRTSHSSYRVHGVQLIQHRLPLLRRTRLDNRSGGRQSLPSEAFWILKCTRNFYVGLSHSVAFGWVCRCSWCELIRSGFISLLYIDALTTGGDAIDGRTIDGKSVDGGPGRGRVEHVFPTPAPGRRPRLLSGEIDAQIQLAKHALGEIAPNMATAAGGVLQQERHGSRADLPVLRARQKPHGHRTRFEAESIIVDQVARDGVPVTRALVHANDGRVRRRLATSLARRIMSSFSVHSSPH